jgi:cytochrome c oxidase subunit 2
VKIARSIITASLLLLATACTQPQSTLNPGGPAARNLSQIGWVTYLVFGITAFIMWVLLAWAVMRKRGTLAEHEPWHEGGGQKWVLIGGFAIPFVVLSGMFVFMLDRMSQFPVQDQQQINPEIVIIGHQWWWEVRYVGGPVYEHFTTANEIHIPVGKPIDIELETADVIHSFWVPAMHGKVDMIPGQPNYIRIEASHPGKFPGQCAEYCGEQHAHMRLLVVAQPPAEYEAWRQMQLSPGAIPQTAEALHGQEVFNDAACALCHTVRGTPAEGKVAPDLTHFGSRKMLGADSFVNNEANLEAWVVHAQSLKPGCLMPNLTEFNGTDVRALVAYLQQLK